MSTDLTKTSTRIDKWLWAARFFKTRSLAKQAVEGGKVHLNGQRAKASKDVYVGMTLSIRQGWDLKEIVITAISDQRRGHQEALQLYQETEQSIEARALHAAQRKAMGASAIPSQHKPSGRERRKINELKRFLLDDPD